MSFNYIRILVICLVAFCSVGNVASQSSEEKKLLKKARKALSEGNYVNAKANYLQLLQMNPSSADYNFETGLSYYNSEIEREKSLTYFTASLNNSGNDTIAELLYYLGRAHHYVHEFDKAIDYYNRFRKLIDADGAGEILGRDVNHYIEMCNNGLKFQGDTPQKIEVVNMGNRVNSEYGEYAPIVKKDGTYMLFTARKKGSTGGKYYHDNKLFEDIYISNKQGETWSAPSKLDSSLNYISTKINSKYHDAAIAFNEDETKLFIYRSADIWQSELKDGKWSEPVRMNDNLNSKEHEPSVYISPDEKTLLLTSNRKEGKGGRDIYLSNKLEDGSWGPVTLLGDEINTIYDDDAPFLTRDGLVLYFSSKGHNSMGGYDIFKSYKDEEGKWTAPENLGFPINSAGDDIYYIQNIEGTSAFYASNKANGYGDMDLYEVSLECKSIPNTEIRGLVVAGENQLPVGAVIKVYDKESGDEMGTYNVDRNTGLYMMVLPPEKTYNLEIIAEGFEASRPHKEEFTLPKQCDFFQLFQEIEIRKIKDDKNRVVSQEATFNNAFFDIKKETLKDLGIVSLPEDDMDLKNVRVKEENEAITGKLMHNDLLPLTGAEVMLVNNDGEIIKTTRTDKNGVYQFYNLSPNEKFVVMIDESDALISMYGDAPTNPENDVFIKGTVKKMNLLDKKLSPLPEIEIYIVNQDKKVIATTKTDVSGEFLIDNHPLDKTRVNELADNEFPYHFDLDYPEAMFSTYIKTIDPNNNEINYSEFIDIIHFEHGGIDIPQFENILFDFDKYFLRQKSVDILQSIYEFMAANPTVSIHMDGHTDWKGTEPYNVKLSEKRSNAALNYLIEKGIDPKRMEQAWHGEIKPTVPNANPDGSDNPDNRQLNRRCEFQINIPNGASLTLTF
jgi:outer membrane protein OmpA-like peptidoglycan-associated protein/tetratricopeptide (TPR) repeat protein